MSFPPRAGRVSGRATPSPRHAQRAKSQRTNPAAVHLTFAESCADKRDQLSHLRKTEKTEPLQTVFYDPGLNIAGMVRSMGLTANASGKLTNSLPVPK